MAALGKNKVRVEATINARLEKVWEMWTDPKHIVGWNHASDDWHTVKAENDIREGGKFSYRMEATDGSLGFDFSGTYTDVEKPNQIKYKLDDGRRVEVDFVSLGDEVMVNEILETEKEHPEEMQQAGWQAILNNFKKYVENEGSLKNSMHFEIIINARPAEVYKTMIDKELYSKWTSEFNPDSKFVGSWESGSTIHFTGTDKDGVQGGMVSIIRENNPNKFISIEHVGIIKDGKEHYSGPDVDTWAGSLENYTFLDDNDKTLLLIDMVMKGDIGEDTKNYFVDTWPKALMKLKSIIEDKELN
jgi:uncharacterized protein YndB with AHSA1/START domain